MKFLNSSVSLSLSSPLTLALSREGRGERIRAKGIKPQNSINGRQGAEEWGIIKIMTEEPDYIFRYPVGQDAQQGERDPLLRMIRIQLQSLLKLLALYHEGEEVQADGFRLRNEREAVHPIFASVEEIPKPQTQPSERKAGKKEQTASFQMAENAELYEPRIPHLKRILESLLSVVDLESNGKPVKIDGFRLKNLDHWLVRSDGDPAEVFDHLATQCDCRCSFCYLQGNPPSVALRVPKRSAREDYEEARTRLKYFFPRKKQALFPTIGSPHEFLSHPFALDLLAELRPKTDRPLRLSTNGNKLTAKFISRLSSLKPIYLYLSLNSSSPIRRKEIMGGRNPEVAIRALPLLKERQIGYAVIVVPWPIPAVQDMLHDLTETVLYADRHDAHLVEISLPGTSQFFSRGPLYNLEEVWSGVVSTIRSLRERVATPLLVKPSMYEESLHEKRRNLPRVIGIVKNSPAAHAGLRPGDLILAINGLRVSSRPQARDILHIHHLHKGSSVSLSIQSQGEMKEAEIRPDQFGYPYAPETDHHLGIIFMGAGFRPSVLEDLKALITARGARRVLFLSSALVRPVFEQALQESSLFGDIQIQVRIPSNHFFGGNIFMGDLLVVQDFIEAIQDYLQHETPPDLVVIPSSPFALGGWGRDLTGRVYTDIARAVHLPVALLNCEPIYD